MNDDEMLATMRGSLTEITESMTDVRLERPVGMIQARARGRRLRRRLAGVGTGGLALGVGIALAVSGGVPAGGRSPTAARPVHVNLVAWSVNTVSSGLVNVDVRQLQNPTLLGQTLAEAGVPAIVTFGEFCVGPSGGASQSLSQILGKTAAADGEARLTIDPAQIPHGNELSIGIVSISKRGVRGLGAAFGLVPTGAHLTCGQPNNMQGYGAKQGATGPAGAGTVKPGAGS